MTLLQEADRALPQTGPVRERVTEFVGENPVSTFVYHRLARELLAARDGPGGDNVVALSTLPGYADSAAVAARLIDEFESLPWDYVVSLKMPASFSGVFVPHIGSTRLSDTLDIIVPSADYATTHPITEAAGLLLTGYASITTWDQEGCYLQLRTRGFIAPRAATAPMDGFTNTVRAFAGLGVALRLFGPTTPYEQFRPRSEYLVHRREGERRDFDCECWWDTDQAHTFNRLLLDLGGQLDAGRQAGLMRLVFGKMATVFSGAEKARRIRLGAQWLFDSLCTSDQPLTYVQAAVVMEVLLGDKLESEKVGVTELLANRCAYLIADSQSGPRASGPRVQGDLRRALGHRSPGQERADDGRVPEALAASVHVHAGDPEGSRVAGE
jgi:hypothetical protein